jgi:hypothetical protein
MLKTFSYETLLFEISFPPPKKKKIFFRKKTICRGRFFLVSASKALRKKGMLPWNNIFLQLTFAYRPVVIYTETATADIVGRLVVLGRSQNV